MASRLPEQSKRIEIRNNCVAWQEPSKRKCQYCGKEIRKGIIVFPVKWNHEANGYEQIKQKRLQLSVYTCRCFYERREEIDLAALINDVGFPKDLLRLVTDKKKFNKDLILKKVLAYERNLDKNIKAKVGLCLIGGVGIGKTVSLIYLFLKMIDRYKFRPRYITSERLAEYYKSYDFRMKQKYYYYRNKRVLFVDDVNGSWNMHDFVEYRKATGRLTFMASNCDYDRLKELLEEPVISRIKSTMIMEFLKGDDQRELDFSDKTKEEGDWKTGEWLE